MAKIIERPALCFLGKRKRRSYLFASSSLAVIASALPANALADCLPDDLSGTLAAGTEIICASDDADGFYARDQNDITFTVNSGVTVSDTIQLGDNITFINNGVIENTAVSTGLDYEGVGVYLGQGADVTINGSVSTTSDWGMGVFTAENSHVKLYGSIDTIGDNARAIYVLESNLVELFDGAAITTSGANADGVYLFSDNEAVIAGSITTSGDDAYGVNGFDDLTLSLESTGTIAIKGDAASGIKASNDAELTIAGSVSTEGFESDAITMGSTGLITLTETAILSTIGSEAIGLNVGDDNEVNISGSIETGSDYADAVDAGENSLINIFASGGLKTTGYLSDGITLGVDSEVNIDGEISTAGDGADGVAADDGLILVMTEGSSIETQGDYANGIVGVLNDNVDLTIGGSITTEGLGAYGAYLYTNAKILVTSTGSIETSGVGSGGIRANSGLDLEVEGSISTSGDDASAIHLSGDNVSVNISGVVSSQFGDATILSVATSNAVSVTNEASGVINGANDGANAVAFLGGNALETFYNAGTITGDIYLEGGDDTFVYAGGTIDGIVDGGADYDAFEFENGIASISNDAFINFETLTQYGGALTLATDFNFDDVAIDGGELVIGSGATLTSPLVTVGAGAILSGVGNIVGDVVNDGTIAPGMSVGTLTINGDFDLNTGSVVEIFVDESGNSLLVVNGTANLNGGGFLLAGSTIADGQYTIITADTFVENAEIAVVSNINLPFTSVTALSVGTDGVVVDVDTTLDITALENYTPQTQIMGAALAAEISAGLSDEMFEELAALSSVAGDAGIDDAIRGLSPEIYAGAPVVAVFEQDRLLTSSLQNRFRQKSGAEKGARTVWGGAGVSTSRLDGGNGFSATDVNVSAFQIGGDVQLSDAVMLGFFTAVNHADVSFDDLTGGFDGMGYAIGAYSLVGMGAVDLGGFVSFSASEFDVERMIGNDAGVNTAEAIMGVAALHLYVEASREIELSYGLSLRPHVAFDFIEVERDGFTENSSSELALDVWEETEVVSVVDVGAALNKSFDLAPGQSVDTYVGVGYRHSVGDNDAVASSTFVGGSGNAFSVNSAFLPEKAATFEAGFSTKISESWSVTGEYVGAFADDYASHGGKLALNFSF